jgi:hypothetical protein
MPAFDYSMSPALARRGARATGARFESSGRDIESGATALPTPSPRSSDLLTEFLPCGGTTLVQAIDRFLAELEGLGGRLTGQQSPMGLIPVLTTTVLAALVPAVAITWRRSLGDETRALAKNRDDDDRFPGFVNAWSLGEG